MIHEYKKEEKKASEAIKKIFTLHQQLMLFYG